MLLNKEWVKNELKEEVKKVLERSENELKTIQKMRQREGSPEREVYGNTSLSKS